MAQRDAYERIVSGRGKLPRPYATLLASPDVAEMVEKLSTKLWHGALPRQVLEAVFLSVASEQQCRYQWDNHAAKALETGISQECLDGIRKGLVPDQPPALSAALAFASEMQRTKRVQDSTFASVVSHFGEQGTAELCAFLALATTISFLLNVQRTDGDVASAVRP
ncbi:hypothetical protein RD110_21840 [Rhodoferax koreense]|uniref:Carboxymuconolactone decarboxylase-like domain-containing protein n=1 Tax=Rhodoferax koreensis TaxID=1842727 RepID=A0A1P8K0K0_9BURK|nr:hypothetical protein RD110_21840 [Rhodoferax koreense]